MKETDFLDEPRCPHCDHELFDLADMPTELKYDGDAVNCDCENCGKRSMVMMCVSLSFWSKSEEED